MMTNIRNLCLATAITLAGGLTFLNSPVSAETLWLNALTAVPGQTLVLTRPGLAGMIEIKSTNPGSTQWIDFPVAIPSNVEVSSVELCYQLSDASSFISQIRVSEMRTPNSAQIIKDDPTDLTDPGPACITSSPLGTPHQPNGIINVSVRFFFEDTVDWIRIGGIGLNFVPSLVDVEAGVIPASQLFLRNYPNPFASSTTIEFRVPEAGFVALQIYTPTGKLIRNLGLGDRQPGTERIVWDGRDEQGQTLAPGVYFYQIRVGDLVAKKQMVFAR